MLCRWSAIISSRSIHSRCFIHYSSAVQVVPNHCVVDSIHASAAIWSLYSVTSRQPLYFPSSDLRVLRAVRGLSLVESWLGWESESPRTILWYADVHFINPRIRHVLCTVLEKKGKKKTSLASFYIETLFSTVCAACIKCAGSEANIQYKRRFDAWRFGLWHNSTELCQGLGKCMKSLQQSQFFCISPALSFASQVGKV